MVTRLQVCVDGDSTYYVLWWDDSRANTATGLFVISNRQKLFPLCQLIFTLFALFVVTTLQRSVVSVAQIILSISNTLMYKLHTRYGVIDYININTAIKEQLLQQ